MNYVKKFEMARKYREASERHLLVVNDKLQRHLGVTLRVIHTQNDNWCILHSPGDRTTPISTNDLSHLLNLKQAALSWLQEREV